MNNLSIVLLVKILLTVLWCIPLLFFQSKLIIKVGFPDPEPLRLFLRLLGIAYTALLVGYVIGLKSSLQGYYPGEIVWVGIVSNGGACLILISAALTKVWGEWGKCAKIAMWASLVLTGIITVGLCSFGLLRP